MITGDPDGEAADRIRGEMEAPRHAMSESEQDLVRGLSADLYTIARQREAPREPAPALAAEVESATHEGNPQRALELLRQHESHLPPAWVAYWRGACWAELGAIEVAQAFLEEAVRLDPSCAICKALLLRAMIVAGQAEKAAPLARQVRSAVAVPSGNGALFTRNESEFPIESGDFAGSYRHDRASQCDDRRHLSSPNSRRCRDGQFVAKPGARSERTNGRGPGGL
jgi:tetratricopeptide (TPR) repeat protein